MTRLGQNFLKSKNVAKRMADEAGIQKNDAVLEIGPGQGILTEELLKKCGKVIAVEKDPELYEFLKQKFSTEEKSKRLALIRADIRDFLKNSVRPPRFNKVVANIPYYLTGQLLRLLLAQMYQVGLNTVVLMIQKEVAQRIALGQHSELTKKKISILAISVQVFAKARIAFYVSKRNFRPEPKVDSAVIMLERHKKDFFRSRGINQKLFFELVKTGFSHPRKLLKSNLQQMSDIGCLTKCGVSEKARAEDLSLENWACLARLSTLKRTKTK